MNEAELMNEMRIEHACTRLIKRFALLNDAGDYENLAYASAAQAEAPMASPPHLIGTFRDKLRLVKGHWLFSERLGQVDLEIAG